MAAGDPAAYELAFEEGKLALAEQAATLRETRERIGTVVSAAAVVAGLAASLAFHDGARAEEVDAAGIVAVFVAGAALVGLVAAAVGIWWPMKGGFVLDARMLVTGYVEATPPASLSEIHRDVAWYLGEQMTVNRDGIDRRLRRFAVALVCFVLEVGAIVVVLVDLA